jgi:hypothetical protein
MSSFPANPADRQNRRPAGRVPPNRAEPRSAHLSLFWQTRLRGGLSGTCDALPDECSLLCKGHLFARAKLPMCECREPSGNPSGVGGV